MTSNIVRFDPIRSIAFASVTSGYTALGTAFTHSMRVLHFVNDTNGNVMISFDGVTDNVVLLAESFSLYDLTSDQDENESFRYQKGTQIYVKYLTAPTGPATGAVYLISVYGKGE